MQPSCSNDPNLWRSLPLRHNPQSAICNKTNQKTGQPPLGKISQPSHRTIEWADFDYATAGSYIKDRTPVFSPEPGLQQALRRLTLAALPENRKNDPITARESGRTLRGSRYSATLTSSCR
jgi:hypothetical protein